MRTYRYVPEAVVAPQRWDGDTSWDAYVRRHVPRMRSTYGADSLAVVGTAATMV